MSTDMNRRRFCATGGGTIVGALAAGTLAEGFLGAAARAQEQAAEPAPWQQTSDRKIRLGVVGGGFGASFAWHSHPNCEVVAVSDLQKPRRDHLMQVYGCDKSYDSLEELVKDDTIEAVAVFTDAPSHARHTVDCMKHGKHVISAVPAATDLAGCQMIKEMKEKTGLKYMMAETSFFHGDVIHARNLYRKGQKLLYTEGQYYHHRVTFIYSWKNWRHALPPMLYPTHSTAYYVGVTGKRLTKVSCLGWDASHIDEQWRQNQWDNNPFANESAMFRTSEETMCRINVFWWGHAHGETGSWIWEAPPAHQVPRSVSIPPGMAAGGHGGSHGPLADRFIMALVEDREPVIDVYESLAMTAPGIVAHQSALKDGEQLAIPSFDRT